MSGPDKSRLQRRADEKSASRLVDQDLFEAGRLSAQQVNDANNFFSPIDVGGFALVKVGRRVLNSAD